MSLLNPPTPWDPTKLYDLAEQVLGVLQMALTDAGLTVPGLTYVSGNATPTGACDSLVVGWERIGHGTPTGMDSPYQVKGQMSPRRAWLSIWLFRCLTDTLQGESEEIRGAVVNGPAASSDALTIMSDAYVLHKALVIAHHAGLIGNDYGTPIVVSDFTPLAASGGIGGSRGGLIYELS